ncbi:acyltransferase family protein [Azospirillum picis]|uniref:Fucose 4-O-acetylase-like acetyltransferase n=1 Tax=Azospirillum picis TaxID=488438 RepID=A0ABU0MU12_9PROT|nr:acyltransferase family protein [Azospirillum picis]MBP2303215.1 fucose 4-O-acetylase-like acetyltransferase [Azospirillum picis]MDQ0536978.1 fucose 4-O-acetylase-like acetyltransferase [Azospirillum picis]
MSGSIDKTQKMEVNVAKGIGIILVVIGHNSAPVFEHVNVYIYHMPLFFLLSGIGLNPTYSLPQTLIAHAKSLLLYAAAMTFVYSIIGWAIQSVYGIHLLPPAGFSLRYATTRLLTGNGHDALLFLVGWFLIALFFARSLAFLIIKQLARLRGASGPALLVAVAILFCYLGLAKLAPRFQETHAPYLNLLSQVLVGCGFVILGYLHSASTWLWRWLRSPLTALVLMVALYESVVGLAVTPMSMAWSQYPSGFGRHMLTALLGSFAVLSVAAVLAQTKHSAVFAFVGKHSKTVMAHHLFVFTLINAALIQTGLVPAGDVTIWYAWKVTVMWPVYVGLGVGLPLVGHLLRQRPYIMGPWLALIGRLPVVKARLSPDKATEQG